MKYLVFLALLINTAQAATMDRKLFCSRKSDMIASLHNKFQEAPIWIGDSSDSRVALFVNQAEQTFTLVEFDGEFMCVLQTGRGFKNIGVDLNDRT